LSSAHIKVLIGECVWNVPTDGTELSSVLYDGVEERESEQELFVLSRFTTVVQWLVIEPFIILEEILTKSRWWLHRHF